MQYAFESNTYNTHTMRKRRFENHQSVNPFWRDENCNYWNILLFKSVEPVSDDIKFLVRGIVLW